MDLIKLLLRRIDKTEDGIFGTLTDNDGNTVAITLEHAYPYQGSGYTAKVAPGAYTCVRHAPNRLPYETFELQDVPEFEGNPVTGILLHIGNYNHDSDGCILLGDERNGSMIMNSKITFEKFMDTMKDVDTFQLTIEEAI